MITILSSPRCGTRFFMHFVSAVLAQPVRYYHFNSWMTDEIQAVIDSADIIICPVRSQVDQDASFNAHPRADDARANYNDSLATRDTFMPQLVGGRAHFMDLEKPADVIAQFTAFLTDAGLSIDQAVTNFITNWPVIGAQDDPDTIAVQNLMRAQW